MPTHKAIPLLREDRKRKCLSYEYRPNIFPAAGVELWRLKQLNIDRYIAKDEGKKDRELAGAVAAEDRSLTRDEGKKDREYAAAVASEDRKWTRRAVLVMAGAAVVTLVVGLLTYFKEPVSVINSPEAIKQAVHSSSPSTEPAEVRRSTEPAGVSGRQSPPNGAR